jgi:hypothetical protein
MTSQSRLVTHDVPVTVIPRRHWDEYDEPEIPDFDVRSSTIKHLYFTSIMFYTFHMRDTIQITVKLNALKI